MLTILPDLRPSSLAWGEDLSEAARDLRDNCCRSGGKCDVRVLDAWYADAEKLSAEGDCCDCAVVMIHLADLYREMGLLAQALECSRNAVQYSYHVDRPQHLQTRAAAVYSLGLNHQLMGSHREALKQYSDASTLFDTARQHWIRTGNERWTQRCGMAMRWIWSLREKLAQLRAGGGAPDRALVSVPVFPRIAAGDPLLADQQFDEWTQVDIRWIDQIHFALRVRGDSMVDEGIHDGDLVLVQRDQSEPSSPGQTVVVLIDRRQGDATVKKYYREADHIRLEPANTHYPFLILRRGHGSEDPIRDRYKQSHPNKTPVFYSGVDPLIVGRVRGVA